MGLADREYYQEHLRNLEREAQASASRGGHPPRPPVDVAVGPPDLPGANWPAWTKVLVWIAILTLLFLAFKHIEMRDRIKKLEAERLVQVEAEKRRADAERKERPLPRVDFFK